MFTSQQNRTRLSERAGRHRLKCSLGWNFKIELSKENRRKLFVMQIYLCIKRFVHALNVNRLTSRNLGAPRGSNG